MIRNLNNMCIDEFIRSWGSELSNLSTTNYTQVLTREDFINARNILSGTSSYLTEVIVPNTINENPCKEEVMSERMPKRAKIIKLISGNETEDEMFIEYVGMTFNVTSVGSTYKGAKGYKLCLDKNKPDLNDVRFSVDELELYYEDEMKGEY